MPPIYIPQMVNLEVNDLRIIRQVAEEEGLGRQGFSAALRQIIREWYLLNRSAAQPLEHPDDSPPEIL